jgi:serine phosphatase RsbU (regulator of sigma subunit)
VIPRDADRLLLVVGDVSGRGLRAAATMASLRYAIHAYAAQGDPPETILTKLSSLLDVTSSGHLATILCADVNVGAREITLASAGHLPSLLISDGRGTFIDAKVGLPVGVSEGASYVSSTVVAGPGATLLAFTDGLVERRGEDLDQGLARLRDAAVAKHGGLDELLSGLVAELHSEPAEDDGAIVGLRWTA